MLLIPQLLFFLWWWLHIAALIIFSYFFVVYVSGAPRYGKSMYVKIEELKNMHHKVLCQIFPNAEAQSIAVLSKIESSFNEEMDFLQTQDEPKAVELERRKLDEDLQRAHAQREAVARVEEENVRRWGE